MTTPTPTPNPPTTNTNTTAAAATAPTSTPNTATTTATEPNQPPSSTPFPTLLPALTFRFKIGSPALVGSLSRGQPLTVVPIVSGTVQSEPGFRVAVDAGVRGGDGALGGGRYGGCDFVRNDPDGKRMRLDCRVLVEDADGNIIHIHYTGVVDITPELSAILGGSFGAKTTEYGHSFIHVTFETGCDQYKELETGVYVGAGRFIIDERGLSVEYKVSKVTYPSGGGESAPSTGDAVGSGDVSGSGG